MKKLMRKKMNFLSTSETERRITMKRSITIIAFIIFVAGIFVSSMAMAKGKNGPAGKSNVGHLYLYEKTGEPDWEIVEGGAWGKIKYNLSGSRFEFVFNGHYLEAEYEYTLIYYPDPWPGEGLICLGSGMANANGDVHIRGSVDTGDLPSEDDDNFQDGAKIWLVLSDDVDCEEALMTGWSPTFYLFEYDLITFDDTDEE